jgi:Protein of unknown function (DUF2752)
MSIGLPVPVFTRRPLAVPLLATGAAVVGCGVLQAVDPSGGPTICPFKAWTGLDCPGCGATRAAHQLLNGHVLAALDLNAMFVLAVPLLAWWAIARLLRAWDGPALRVPRLSPTVLRVAIVVLLVFAVVRNLPVQPFAWLGTGT